MKLRDALYNWLQMHIVVSGRPDDEAAHETLAFFREILAEDHRVTDLSVASVDEKAYEVAFRLEDGSLHRVQFDREEAERLLADINATPQFNRSGPQPPT